MNFPDPVIFDSRDLINRPSSAAGQRDHSSDIDPHHLTQLLLPLSRGNLSKPNPQYRLRGSNDISKDVDSIRSSVHYPFRLTITPSQWMAQRKLAQTPLVEFSSYLIEMEVQHTESR
ncbi:hypothetical protein TWF694_005499 [Orbilia ellipsospora]|uniref:Uncharacterized protein n=1 Tax=Orbilia ellipsospora TaxID=2528407 RepID=A0AAV9WTC2_9PEZI